MDYEPPPPSVANWETVGPIWYDVLTGGQLRRGADFSTFARATIAAAQARFGPRPTPPEPSPAPGPP